MRGLFEVGFKFRLASPESDHVSSKYHGVFAAIDDDSVFSWGAKQHLSPAFSLNTFHESRSQNYLRSRIQFRIFRAGFGFAFRVSVSVFRFRFRVLVFGFRFLGLGFGFRFSGFGLV